MILNAAASTADSIHAMAIDIHIPLTLYIFGSISSRISKNTIMPALEKIAFVFCPVDWKYELRIIVSGMKIKAGE